MLKQVFRENESYKHKMAKQVLKEWFDSKSQCIGDISVTSNRESGVLLEYPVCVNDKINSIDHLWDEIIDNDHPKYGNEYVPTFDECINKFKCPPIAILDIALCHKGSIVYGIEIKHRHKVPSDKINKLKEFNFTLIEIDAEWILRHTKCPDKLKYKTLIE